MKNFKLKLNFLLSFFRKNKFTKKISNILQNLKYRAKIYIVKKKTFELLSKFNFKRLKIRYIIFFLVYYFSITLFICLFRGYYMINQTKTTLLNYLKKNMV